jgi:hypothetical protein
VSKQGKVEQSVELYALASLSQFVANAKAFEDIAGKHITAFASSLPPEVIAAAEARGRELEIWETARELLAELEAQVQEEGGDGCFMKGFQKL